MSPVNLKKKFENFLRLHYWVNSISQGFGSGSGLDPYSIGPVDPDPDPYSESGSRRARMTHKSRKNSCFEVLDDLFCVLQASSVTWTYFMEA
jgi:hypothetical protein